ncbi:hypothetical protein QBC32DRAFT_329158 [Pseudoneurospora amorphoporcata]|uniref:Uncharacterized protein n=1 Tax=Pseudoneurospora amorphoporcata TaxID=241081 RepID=A0AAN6NK36_9PEZI|nr:hypothetical protein QBC32DRAFT_329158 [Pseudoneurospora amorphoporcata]
MTAHNILTGFTDTGIWPPNREKVLTQVRAKQPKQSNPALPTLLPKEQRFTEAIEVITHIKDRYLHTFSSPTRIKYRSAEVIAYEAALINDTIQERNRQDREREANLDRRMRRRKQLFDKWVADTEGGKGKVTWKVYLKNYQEQRAKDGYIPLDERDIDNIERKGETSLWEVDTQGKKLPDWLTSSFSLEGTTLLLSDDISSEPDMEVSLGNQSTSIPRLASKPIATLQETASQVVAGISSQMLDQLCDEIYSSDKEASNGEEEEEEEMLLPGEQRAATAGPSTPAKPLHSIISRLRQFEDTPYYGVKQYVEQHVRPRMEVKSKILTALKRGPLIPTPAPAPAPVQENDG